MCYGVATDDAARTSARTISGRPVRPRGQGAAAQLRLSGIAVPTPLEHDITENCAKRYDTDRGIYRVQTNEDSHGDETDTKRQHKNLP